MFIASKPSILLAIFILFSVSNIESLNIDIYQRVLNKLLTKNLKNHFQPSTTRTTEKPPSTEKMTFDKSPTKTTSTLESNSSNSHHSQKDCLQKCTYTKWIYSLCRCLIHKWKINQWFESCDNKISLSNSLILIAEPIYFSRIQSENPDGCGILLEFSNFDQSKCIAVLS